MVSEVCCTLIKTELIIPNFLYSIKKDLISKTLVLCQGYFNSCKQRSIATKRYGTDHSLSAKAITANTTFNDLWSSEALQKSQIKNPNIKPILVKNVSNNN